LFQAVWKTARTDLANDVLAGLGATIIAISSVLNGLGRFFWGGLSDKIGRSRTFTILFMTKIVAFFQDNFPADRFPGKASFY
jgi:OFA family oxalate/formate antiporter-like MFS transporter